MSAGSSFGERLAVIVNVATCAAYVAAGTGAAVWRPGMPGLVFGGWLVILGAASGWYHWQEGSLRALRADHAAMYATFVALLLYAASDARWAWVTMIGAGLFFGWHLALTPERTTVVSMVVLQPVMILCGGVAIAVVLIEGVWWMAVVALATFGVAWWAWHRPGAWGHGTWHVLTAAAILLLFLGVR